MTYPRMLMHAETRVETTLVTEETGLLEEPTYECLPSLEDQCEEKLTTFLKRQREPQTKTLPPLSTADLSDDKENFISYDSRTLDKAERNYSTTRREIPTLISFTKKYSPARKRFKVRTDHQAIV